MTLTRIRTWLDEHQWQVIVGLFGALLLIGWLVCGDYATSMDEPPLFEFGMQAWEYLFRGGVAPTAIDWHFHTPVYQFLFINVARFTSSYGFVTSEYVSRFVSFLVFCIGWWSLFFLAVRVTKDRWWSLFIVVCFALSPRMFAHAFYNPKDLPTLVFFTLAVLMLVRLLEKRTVVRTLLFGLVAGFSISLRPFALLLPCFAILCFGVQAWTATPGKKREWVLWCLASLVATFLLTIAVWPLLWHDPLGGLYGAILNNTARADAGFYLGTFYNNTHFPWHYIPVWMFITIPLAYTALCLTGVGVALASLKRPLVFFKGQPVIVLALLWLGIPIVAKMTGKIGLFDEWRHLLFMYPAFLLLAVFGAQWLWTKTRGRARQVLAGIVLLNMFATLFWMVRWHPFEYMFFSVPSSWMKGQMEMDYWGLSYFEGLKWIAANDKSDRIPIYIRNDVGIGDLMLLPPEDQKRLYAVKSSAQAQYIVDPLRWSSYQEVVPHDQLLHTIDVDGLQILWIYRGPFKSDQLPDYK